MIASRFGGAGEQINLVPMMRDLNLGEWRVMENNWANVLGNNGSVTDVKITINYGPGGRPVSFEVEAKINGVVQQYLHSNQ